MRIAFYAPLKSPDASVPSGDRLIARNFIKALRYTGHDVDIACHLRTFDRYGDPKRQMRLQGVSARAVQKIVRQIRSGARPHPDIWLTYHLYHKAPDWIGPAIAGELDIPYTVAEASVSPRQAMGRWRIGHEGVLAALGRADLILGLNPRDAECVEPYLKAGTGYRAITPFLDTRPFQDARSRRVEHRKRISKIIGIPLGTPWIIAVGMMREGAKLASYRLLAEAMERIAGQQWHLLVAGDGPARGAVEAVFAGIADRVGWLGLVEPDDLPACYAASDLLVWPAVDEALGMVFLEAGAAGLASIAGYTDGVASIVQHQKTGLVVGAHDVSALTDAIASLLRSPSRCAEMGAAASNAVHSRHSLPAVAVPLDRFLGDVVQRDRT